MLLSLEMIHVTFLAESTSSPYLVGDLLPPVSLLLPPVSSSLSSSEKGLACSDLFFFLGDVLVVFADDAQLLDKLLFDAAASEVAGDLRPPVGGCSLLLPLARALLRLLDFPIEALVPDEILLMLMSALLLLFLLAPPVPLPVFALLPIALWEDGIGLAAGLQSKSESELLLVLPTSKTFADAVVDAAAAAAAAFFLAALAFMLTPPLCRFVEEGVELTAGDCLTDGLLLLLPVFWGLPAPGWALVPIADFVGVAAAFDGDRLLFCRATNAVTSSRALLFAAANLALASSPLMCSSLRVPLELAPLPPLPLGLLPPLPVAVLLVDLVLSRPSNRPTMRRATEASILDSNTPIVRTSPAYVICVFQRCGLVPVPSSLIPLLVPPVLGVR